LDRQIVYAGAVPLDTDQLLQSRNTMVGLGYLAKMVIGDGASHADGLPCTHGPGLSIIVGPGSLTSPTVVDAGFIGLLPPDGDLLVKIGVNTASVVLPISGSGTWLVSAAVSETQAGNAVVVYYNAAMPAQTLFGPNGDGAAQASVLQQRVALGVSNGTATPAGAVPLWLVNVPAGADAITSDMISMAPGAPFLAVKLPEAAPLASPALTGTPNAPTPAAGDVSSLLATTAFVSAATTRFRSVWESIGTYSWNCPEGVSQVFFRGWGPGGAGGIGSGGYPGGGGGGGGYLEVLLDIQPGATYAVVIGVGGTNSVSVSPTGFGGILSVFGGGNGGNGGGGQSGNGGTSGSNAVLQLAVLSNPGSGTGQSGYVLSGVAVGGAGGATFGIGSGHPTIASGAGAVGIWPGGGGSGAASGAGGNGAGGLVILEWCGNAA
jgi:hypothetical protein